MKLTKAIDISLEEMIDIFFTMRADQQQEFLNAIQSDVRASIKPKKLTAKQQLAYEAALLRKKWEARDKIAAEKEYPKYLEYWRTKRKEEK